MSEPESQNKAPQPSVMDEISRCWTGFPDKLLFLTLLGSWLVFFQFLGNSTFGYVDTHSLYAWMNYAYSTSKDDELGYIIPLIVLGLCYWKRDELLAVPKRNWWPALLLVALALAIHLTGYVIQQSRVSILGFYFGIYALSGVIWGPSWLKASFFPCLLFAFGIPVGTMAETVTVPLSHLASDITGWICGTLLGIDIFQQGVQIWDDQGKYKYAIAAACSGLRSLIVTLAFFTIYGFVSFSKKWKTALIVFSAFPLAVAGNVFRLTLIILAAEIVESAKPGSGQAAGDFVHDNGILSLLPYFPAFVGVLILGRIIKEDDRPKNHEETPASRWKLSEDLARIIHNAKKLGILIAHFILLGGTAAFIMLLNSAGQTLGKPGVQLAAMEILNETNKVVRTNGVALPINIMQCTSKPTPVTTLELDWLPPDTTYGRRRYTFPDKTWIENSVVLMGQDRTSIHKPEYCLPGQGFTINRREVTNIPMTLPHTYNLPVMKLTTSKTFRDRSGNDIKLSGIYVYWFVADGKLATDHFERMWMMTKGLLSEGELQRWAYVTYFAICAPGTEDKTFEKISEFIRESVPKFQLTAGPKKS